MPIRKHLDGDTFDERQIQVLTEAFEEALRLADIEDRTSSRAECVALRVIDLFKSGESDPGEIARIAAGN